MPSGSKKNTRSETSGSRFGVMNFCNVFRCLPRGGSAWVRASERRVVSNGVLRVEAHRSDRQLGRRLEL